MSKVNQGALAQPFFSQEHLSYLYLTHEGRVNRAAYWKGALSIIGINLAVQFVLGELIGGLITLALIYPMVMLGIKRCHDREKSGHFLWLSLIPVLNLWPFVELGFFPGTAGSNDYGSDPIQDSTQTT